MKVKTYQVLVKNADNGCFLCFNIEVPHCEGQDSFKLVFDNIRTVLGNDIIIKSISEVE